MFGYKVAPLKKKFDIAKIFYVDKVYGRPLRETPLNPCDCQCLVLKHHKFMGLKFIYKFVFTILDLVFPLLKVFLKNE